MNRHWLLVLFFLLFATSLSFAQNTSNKGKDFWVTYSGHVNGTSSKLTLFLSADRATTYTVYIGNTVIANGNITANTCLPVIIDPNSHPVYIDGSDIIESNKGIHVVSESPISLYSVISFNARTGGTLVLPTNTLGKEYYTYSYQSSITNGNYAQFTILAVEDETEIEITPTSGNAQHLANVTFTITLNKGQIYQFQARDDLSGSHIKSTKECKTIAVFSGNTWASFCERGNSRSASGGDNLYQQLFPVTAWGRNFVTAPFYNTIHGNTDVIRVIVSEDNTVLTVNNSTTDANGTTLSNPYRKGSVVTFFSTSANIISGSNPISVAQYQTSQTCNLNNHAQVNQNAHDPYEGDPEITVLNPVEQTLTNITVYSKLKNVPTNIVKFFINVIIKTADIPSFRLDGNAVSGFVNIGAGYSYAIIDVTSYPQDQHRLTAAGGFSAIAYGYGYVESYAYLAGANIQNFIFQPLNEATGKNITSGCLGEIIRLKINLPYQPTKLIWNVNNGDGTITQTAPTSSDTFTDNGIDYYTYFYPNEIKYNTPDDYQFKVIATKPTADNCGNMEEELIADFTVDNQPTADPDMPSTGCQSSGTQFRDKSKSNSDTRSIASWLWDFGDGETSTEQNPIHIFKKAGLFNVILTATTDSKCSDTHMPVSILINPQPLSDFEVSALCKGKPIKIIEKSTIENPGKIVKWTWNFGDGSADDTNQVPVHQYAAPGSYTITLTTESDKGCVSVVKTKTVTVIDPRPAEFELPDFCLTDGIAKFKNSSKNPDGTVTGLTAQWTYTDNNGNVVASSVGFNGAFTPIATGDYTITLILTNQDGCVVQTAKRFTVNGDVKEANFDIINNHSCVSEDIIIKNTSTVFTGKIIKIEIYRDYPNETSIYKTIPYPDDSEIHLKYDTFGGTTDRTYNIRLVAFSGEKCFEFLDKQITLKPVPQLEFEDMAAVCDADGTVRIAQAKQKVGEGMAGAGVYSGDGIKPDGTFNPKIAGVGFHEITYTYTGENSCSASITKSIEVYKSPVADAGALIYILAGGQIEIPATAEGTNLKYQWSPAIGLNKTDILNPIASPEKDTEYTLTATTQPDGCTTTSSIMIKVLQSLNPPNAFTPNGDNVNDTWNIKYLESYPNATIEIFNRNGNKVFFSNGYKVPFDGTYQNEPLPVGVYYYIINPRNGRKTITGPLTIIR
jgi:gliding motility-associated-like protein